MLHDFLIENEVEILAMTEKKSRDLAENGPNSDLLKKGLPIFYQQLIRVMSLEQGIIAPKDVDKKAMAQAARDCDEAALSQASGRAAEERVADSAGLHGLELLRLGYTLSHVVHAYGAMCQSITELAMRKNAAITTTEFHDLNQCLDVAMAGAVTAYATKKTSDESTREIEHLGFLAHELRNSLNTVVMAYDLVKDGTVTPRGSTGKMVEKGLKRLNDLIDRSLTEVRLRVDPKVIIESSNLSLIVDQIVLTAKIEAQARNQILEINVDPTLDIEADQQLFHSALSNLIQNALKYTREGGTIKIRGQKIDDKILIEVEDECGGLAPNAETDLFKPFEQQNENRKGLGLGLTIAQRAIILNEGTISVKNLVGKGCIFKIALPLNSKNTKNEIH